MTDGTGAQTDEVRRALDIARRHRETLRDQARFNGVPDFTPQLVWDEIGAAIDVLSAEIERLTRRVEELQTNKPALTGLQEAMIEMGFYQPELLASAAAPDERVLAERERCARIADRVYERNAADAQKPGLIGAYVAARTGQNIAAEIRGTPDQDTAPNPTPKDGRAPTDPQGRRHVGPIVGAWLRRTPPHE